MEEIDAAALSAQVSNEIFGEGGTPPSDPLVEPSPPAGNGESSLVVNPVEPSPLTSSTTGKPLPKAWKKEMEAHWAKLSPEVHEYVYTREGDVSRGIQGYKTGHDAWNSVIGPHQEVLQQYPDVNPVSLLQNLMQSHLTLVQGNAEQKRTIAKQLLEAYGIDLTDPQPGQPGIPDLSQYLAPIQKELQSLKQDRAQERQAEAMKVVEAFFKDPANEFANDVQSEILHLVRTGAAADLKSAYEQAVWLNPEVRAKMIAKQAAPVTPLKSASKLNKVLQDTPQNPAPRKGTIDDTIQSIVSKHYSSNH
jgi:hypothetical protein